jgi:hypothetical protein
MVIKNFFMPDSSSRLGGFFKKICGQIFEPICSGVILRAQGLGGLLKKNLWPQGVIKKNEPREPLRAFKSTGGLLGGY